MYNAMAQNPELSVKVDATKYRSVTTAQRDAYVVPVNEFWRIYNTTTNQFQYWNGAAWVSDASGGGGSSVWGGITGTLSNQLDLQAVLDSKQDNVSAGSGISITTNTISVDTGDAIFGNFDKDVLDDFSGSWNDLTDVPAGFADGTDDGAGINNIVEDTTPELGGTLDAMGNSINNVGTISTTGRINTSEVRFAPDNVVGSTVDENTLGFKTGNVMYAQKVNETFEFGIDFNALTVDQNLIVSNTDITWNGVSLLSSGGGSGIASLADDPSPQLSAFLDAQNNQILNAGSILNNGNYIGTHNADSNFGPGVGNGAFNFFDGGIRFGNGSSTANLRIDYSALTSARSIVATDADLTYNGQSLLGGSSLVSVHPDSDQSTIDLAIFNSQASLDAATLGANDIGFCPTCSPADNFTGTEIPLDGYYQRDDTGTDTATWTLGTTKDGGSVEILINLASEPSVTGSTVVTDSEAFQANTLSVLTVKSFSGTVKHWFTSL